MSQYAGIRGLTVKKVAVPIDWTNFTFVRARLPLFVSVSVLLAAFVPVGQSPRSTDDGVNPARGAVGNMTLTGKSRTVRSNRARSCRSDLRNGHRRDVRAFWLIERNLQRRRGNFADPGCDRADGRREHRQIRFGIVKTPAPFQIDDVQLIDDNA